MHIISVTSREGLSFLCAWEGWSFFVCHWPNFQDPSTCSLRGYILICNLHCIHILVSHTIIWALKCLTIALCYWCCLGYLYKLVFFFMYINSYTMCTHSCLHSLFELHDLWLWHHCASHNYLNFVIFGLGIMTLTLDILSCPVLMFQAKMHMYDHSSTEF